MKLKKKTLNFKNCLLLLHNKRRQKSPQQRNCKLRVYTLSADISWYLHYIQQRSIEEISDFYSCDYRERLTVDVTFDADMLEEAILSGNTLLRCTGYIINEDEIMEIDDGLMPIFFYIQKSGIERISAHKTADLTGCERNSGTQRLMYYRLSGQKPLERIGYQI